VREFGVEIGHDIAEDAVDRRPVHAAEAVDRLFQGRYVFGRSVGVVHPARLDVRAPALRPDLTAGHLVARGAYGVAGEVGQETRAPRQGYQGRGSRRRVVGSLFALAWGPSAPAPLGRAGRSLMRPGDF